MLDTWLKVAYDHSREDKAEADLLATMKQLPMEELHKLAMGMACSSDRGPDWLDHFKGTPLFEQAIQLEQEDIQLEMARKQQSEQDRAMWDMRDQLHMKKRLLDIQLAQMEQQELMGGAAGGAPPAPAAAPPAAPAGAPPGGAPPAAAGGGVDPATGQPKSVTVKMGAAMPEQQGSGHPDARSLGLMEAMLALGLGGPPGLLGAQKGMQHSGEGLEGGIRGALGYMGGAPIGAALGHAAGNIGVGLAGGGPEARALGGGAGRMLGGLAGGVGGYKLLTSKYNNPPAQEHKPEHKEPAPHHEEGKEASAEVLQAVAWARELARADREKVADAVTMIETGVAMGQALAKTGAFDPTALLGQAKGLAGRAMGAVGSYAKANPAVAMGALGGAVGGAAHGAMQTDEHGQHSLGKAIGGGLLGGAAGGLGAHAGSSIAQSVQGGTPVGAAVKHYAGHWGDVLRNAVGKSAPAAMTAPASLG